MPLDAQRILFIGIPASAIPARTNTFFDTFNVDEFHLVAWNEETFVADTQEKTDQLFQSYHHPFVHRRFKELYAKKIAKIMSWIKDGRVLVIFRFLFGPGPQTDRQNSVVIVDVNQFIPLISQI
jgi:hypothetical protein